MIFSGCQSPKDAHEKQGYLRWVGDIIHNDEMDKWDFVVCNGDGKILQYFNLGKGPVYKGEKPEMENTFKSQYKPPFNNKESGLIRLRFIVNCEGKAGRFRILQANQNYEETEFDDRIVSQLENIAKKIEIWEVLYKDGLPVDYYMYLIFRIDNGTITEILP